MLRPEELSQKNSVPAARQVVRHVGNGLVVMLNQRQRNQFLGFVLPLILYMRRN